MVMRTQEAFYFIDCSEFHLFHQMEPFFGVFRLLEAITQLRCPCTIVAVPLDFLIGSEASLDCAQGCTNQRDGDGAGADV
jgi:hypothetical protein